MLGKQGDKQQKKQGEGQVAAEHIETAVEAAFDTMFFGSDKVIKEYGIYRNNLLLLQDDPIAFMLSFGGLLKTMRKDLGHRFTKVDEVDLLAMFVNMTDEQRLEYKQKLKLLKSSK